MAHEQEMKRGGFFAGREAVVDVVPASRLAAGPFDATPARQNMALSLPDALITGLLIVYPLVATVVAVIVGLFIAGPLV